jgi:hypothetical protein
MDRPNIILLTVDTLRADTVGYMGYPRPITPNIDRLASGECGVYAGDHARFLDAGGFPRHYHLDVCVDVRRLFGAACRRHGRRRSANWRAKKGIAPRPSPPVRC